MKKTILFGSVLSILILVMTPYISNIQSINGESISKENNQNIYDNDLIEIECKYYLKDDIKIIEGFIQKSELIYINELIELNDYDELVIALSNLNLIPDTLSIEETKELVNGNYGKELYSKQKKIFELITNENEKYDFDCKINLFNVISGSANQGYYFGPLSLITLPIGFLILAMSLLFYDLFDWYPLIELLKIYLGPKEYYYLGIIDVIAVLLISFPQFYSYLFSLFPHILFLRPFIVDLYYSAKINTVGLFGDWSLSKKSITTSLLGFTGIWISIPDNTNINGCAFSGFSALTLAFY